VSRQAFCCRDSCPIERHPMRVYAFMELGIAAFGLLTLFALPLVLNVYIAGASSGKLI
jgi:hypothetical protein